VSNGKTQRSEQASVSTLGLDVTAEIDAVR
jgi:hypothetical protein